VLTYSPEKRSGSVAHYPLDDEISPGRLHESSLSPEAVRILDLNKSPASPVGVQVLRYSHCDAEWFHQCIEQPDGIPMGSRIESDLRKMLENF
jgi:hypothetical protein